MMWFVYINNDFVGTVIAGDQQSALVAAQQKFEFWNWCFGTIEVLPRRR